MRYKVGDKVKAKGDDWFNKGEIVEIIMVDKGDPCLPYKCKGNTAESWEFDADLEPLDHTVTFQQKLDRFKREPIGFLVKSKEIADELAKVFEKEGMKSRQGDGPQVLMHRTITENKRYSGIPFVSYNYYKGEQRLVFGIAERAGKDLDKLLDITLEELKSYNAPQTLEDKLALFKAGTHVLHTPTQEIYDKLMVELEKRGYVWAGGQKPTDPEGYWNDGKVNTCVYMGIERFLRGTVKGYKKEQILTLTPEDFNTPQVITITSDGYHRVTAESNGVTAEALCNPTDKFSIHKGSHMALKRLLEKLEEKPANKLAEEDVGFHVGDIVEVLGVNNIFLKEAIGLQGTITRITQKGSLVEFPVRMGDGYEWWFSNSSLKLVRKYNA